MPRCMKAGAAVSVLALVAGCGVSDGARSPLGDMAVSLRAAGVSAGLVRPPETKLVARRSLEDFFTVCRCRAEGLDFRVEAKTAADTDWLEVYREMVRLIKSDPLGYVSVFPREPNSFLPLRKKDFWALVLAEVSRARFTGDIPFTICAFDEAEDRDAKIAVLVEATEKRIRAEDAERERRRLEAAALLMEEDRASARSMFEELTRPVFE